MLILIKLTVHTEDSEINWLLLLMSMAVSVCALKFPLTLKAYSGQMWAK